MIDASHRPIAWLSNLLVVWLENPTSKQGWMVTGDEAILTFKPWHVFEGFILDKDLQHFCSRWPVMSEERCVDSQSKQSIVNPFYPIICMQGWMDRSDSLARSGWDWPDRLPIRPATLLKELNIVCFSPVLELHRSAVTDTKSQCREAKEARQQEHLRLHSLTAAKFKRQAQTRAGYLNTVGWLCLTQGPLLLHISAPSTLWFSWVQLMRNWKGMKANTLSNLCEFQVQLWSVWD